MSILVKALKQAETSHRAARLATARGQPDVPSAVAQEPGADMPPLQAPGHARTGEPARAAPDPYRGLLITLALAVTSAAGFGFWMSGMSSARRPPAPIATIQASAPTPASVAATSAITPDVQMHEAGMQLRLDRHINTLRARAR